MHRSAQRTAVDETRTYVTHDGHSRLENLRGIPEEGELERGVEDSRHGVAVDYFVQEAVADRGGDHDFHAVERGEVVQ